jgi:hypothetical protein
MIFSRFDDPQKYRKMNYINVYNLETHHQQLLAFEFFAFSSLSQLLIAIKLLAVQFQITSLRFLYYLAQ